ncbi:MAG: PhoU domain-containing protein [Bacteroidota bacterium]
MLLFDLFKRGVPALIKQATEDFAFMLDKDRELYEAATGLLIDNRPLQIDLQHEDAAINDTEIKIRRALLQHFSTSASKDFVFGLMLLTVVQDAERIGDLGKAIAKAAAIANHPRRNTQVSVLSAVRDRTLVMFDQTRQAFMGENREAGWQVIEDGKANKKTLETFVRDLAATNEADANLAVTLTLGARAMSRVGSHLSNIASAVVLPFHEIRRSSSRGV